MRLESILLPVCLLFSVFFKHSEAECDISGHTFICTNEEQKSIIYQYNLKNTEEGNINITAIEILNSSLPAIGDFLNSLEDEVTRNVREIKLNHCDIRNISENAFSNFEALEVLDLNNDEIESIHFLKSIPKSLREIHMKSNKIREVPDIFSQLENLQIVDFSNCSIENLDFTVFKNNLKLNLVNASHNNIKSSVSGEYLKNIKCVDLSHNELSKYDNIPSYCLDFSATNMTGYQWYNISAKNTTVFIDTFFYSGNQHLRLTALNKMNDTLPIEIQYLNISNFQGKIPSDLDLQKIKVRRELILKDSKILSLEKSSFDFKPLFFDEGTNALFDLSSCSISNVSPLYFEKYNLGTLNLCHNKFKSLGSSVFRDAYIIKLDLCNSTIETIDKQAFERLHTHTLNLSFNSIDELEFLRSIGDIHVLDLSHNALKTIPSGTFFNLNNMKSLDLSYNLIDVIGENSFHHNKVEIIFVNNNKLESIETGTFKDIPNLREVYLQKNPISIIEANAFEYLPNLRLIQLGNTEISVIQPHAFTNLQSLRTLYMNDNRLVNLPAQIFLNVPNLEQLDLSGNSLEVIDGLKGLNLETLRLTVNDRFHYDEFHMPTLKYIYIVDSNPQNIRNTRLYNLEKLYIISSPIAAEQPQSSSDGYSRMKQLDVFSNIKVIPQGYEITCSPQSVCFRRIYD
ncbi:unnamed protein product [Phaedon cochleariae]|uniref:Uncharacterized protein n=1 Tax=Phaedon cochleariae TaxID=80249 RepID=A0A9P0GMJ9_PHACE|nr:unnamed protein product [Phaedon cochleariae]